MVCLIDNVLALLLTLCSDFLVLTDTGTLYRVVSHILTNDTRISFTSLQDFETGTTEANAFTQPEKEGFQVSQVYPIEVGKTDWLICLATKTADLSESVVNAVGDGVDYFLGMNAVCFLFAHCT